MMNHIVIKNVLISDKSLQNLLQFCISHDTIAINMEKKDVKSEMENLNLDLVLVADYLIYLFYKTGQKYSCTRTKIGKLISIFAFKYACHRQKAFNQEICKYLHCGALIKGITYLDRDIYFHSQYADAIKKIDEKELESQNEVPEKYQSINLSEEIVKSLNCVFLNFGAYEGSDLGRLINSVIELEGVTSDEDRINIELFPLLYENGFIALPDDNALKKYLLANI